MNDHPARLLAPARPWAATVGAVLGIVGLDLLVVVAWTTWWHLGSLSTDSGVRMLVSSTTEFLSWTFVPCWIVAALVLVVTTPLARRSRRISPPFARALTTVFAPVLWSLAYCWYYDDPGYLPTAALVAEAAWILTLQPLWTYLVAYRVDSAPTGAPVVV